MTTVRERLQAMKYVQNLKTNNVARLIEVTESGCYCKPVNDTKVVFWANYKPVEVY